MTTSDFDIGVQIPTYGGDEQGDGLLRIQWRNGEQRSKTGGYFFVSAENVGDAAPGEPWAAFVDTFDDGTEVEGYKAETLDMAILCVRSQPFHWSAPNGTTGRYKVWQTKWEKGADNQSMQVEVLALVRGFDDPVVWTSATIKTSFAIISRGGKGEAPGILARLSEVMVRPASKAAGQHLDSYCFWATVGTERDDKGKVVYTPTKGKAVTRPTLHAPAEPDVAWLRTRFAGKAFIAERLIPLREQYEAWRQERRTNDDQPAPAAAGKNAPQPVSDADFYDPNGDIL